ncbi:Saga complex component [Mycena kentingensis (nom. inval.)]|nr:Saga complex component [Mycena kentingensis (nom. inval.)]
MDSTDIEALNVLLERDTGVSEKIKDNVKEWDKKVRIIVGILGKIHSTPSKSMAPLLASVEPVLLSCQEITAAIAEAIPKDQFWRWKEMWSNDIRTLVFAAALIEYLKNGTLLSLPKAAETLGIRDEWKDRFALAVEDYLHGLISLVNELSRYAVNSVTLGDFERPMGISSFVKDIFSGFTMAIESEERLATAAIRQLELLAEVDCWSHAAKSLTRLSSLYATNNGLDTIGRLNRLLSVWPPEESVPFHGANSVSEIHRKLVSALEEVQHSSDREVKAIEDAIERLDVLIALRKAPEPSVDKRAKRPRSPSLGGSAPNVPVTPANTAPSRISITVPARSSSSVPSTQQPQQQHQPTALSALPSMRMPKSRQELLMKQLPLQAGRKVAFHQPSGKPATAANKAGGGAAATGTGAIETGENWILAVVVKSMGDKYRYEVQDPEPQEDGQPGLCYYTNLKAIIPLPDPNAPDRSLSHVSSYPEFAVGATVMALYPDTSCFYRAEVLSNPKMQKGAQAGKYLYKLKFDDDEDQEHAVLAEWVVEWPGVN